MTLLLAVAWWWKRRVELRSRLVDLPRRERLAGDVWREPGGGTCLAARRMLRIAEIF